MRSDALRATAGLTAACLLIALALTAARASAASYTVWSCRGPDGAPLSTQSWQAGDERRATEDSCAEGGAMRARLRPSDNAPGTVHGFRFALPAGAIISGYRIHMYARTAPALYENAFQAGIDDDADLVVEHFDRGCAQAGCTFGALEPPLGDRNLAQVAGIQSAGLVVGVRCGALLGCYAQEGEPSPAEVRMFRSQVEVLRDDVAPTLGAAAGGLVSGAGVAGQTSVTFSAGDSGGGVAALAVLIDGVEVARHEAGGSCTEPFVAVVPCPGELSATLTFDASALAPGPHSALLRAIDAAGNVATSDAQVFSVGPPAPPSPPDAPATPATQPGVTVERIVEVPVIAAPKAVTIESDRDRITLPDSGGVDGLVKDAAGRPVAGAEVIVRSRPFGVRRVKLRVERTLTTDGAGRFAMPAGLVSRLLVLDVDDGSHRAVEQAEIELMRRLRVEARVADRTLRNGSVMRLRADVEGAGGGSAGKVVLVQAVVGGRWATVESLTANADGEAVWRYRFRGTTRRAIYRFRLRVERAGDVWPWETTMSPVVRIGVSP